MSFSTSGFLCCEVYKSFLHKGIDSPLKVVKVAVKRGLITFGESQRESLTIQYKYYFAYIHTHTGRVIEH